MRSGRLSIVFGKVSILAIMSFIAVCGTIAFLVFGVAGHAAWSDYSFRGCPDAVQCDDAEVVMWGAAFVSPVSLLVAIVMVWLVFRTLCRADR